ncbi:regulatory protein, luxR family [bacterium A37T11]|nr:regulatory protein, luxR family [bacterium A37T11]
MVNFEFTNALTMKIHRPIEFTYQKHLQKVQYVDDIIDQKEISEMLSKYAGFDIGLRYAAPVLYLLDYTRSQYMVMTDASKTVLSYHPEQFLEAGIPFLLDIYQKDDFRTYNEHVFAANMLFLKEHRQEDHHRYVFNNTYRLRHRNGSYIPVMQCSTFITSKATGLPLYNMGVVMDISPFKQDSVIYHSIEEVNDDMDVKGTIRKKLVVKNHFYPYEEDKILSKRELHILEMMASGLSSKQIADKFYISEFTVHNHRKSMLKKTNSKNVAELIAFGFRSHLL